jgi:hypothetical protein
MRPRTAASNPHNRFPAVSHYSLPVTGVFRRGRRVWLPRGAVEKLESYAGLSMLTVQSPARGSLQGCRASQHWATTGVASMAGMPSTAMFTLAVWACICKDNYLSHGSRNLCVSLARHLSGKR